MRQRTAHALIGTNARLLLAPGAARLARGLLFGVTLVDPLTYSAMAGVLLLVAAAVLGPAPRAARAEPQSAADGVDVCSDAISSGLASEAARARRMATRGGPEPDLPTCSACGPRARCGDAARAWDRPRPVVQGAW